jgi:hypothetical protein
LAVEVAAVAVVVASSRDAVEIKEVVREDKHFLLQVEVVPVVGVFLQEVEAVVETLEVLELLIQMDLVVPDSLGKDHQLVFPVQVVLAVLLNNQDNLEMQEVVDLAVSVGMPL